MLVQPQFNFRTQAPQLGRARQARGNARTDAACRLHRLGSGERRTDEEKAAACERLKCELRAAEHRAEIGSERSEGGHGQFEEAAMLQVHAGKPGDAVHGGRKPHGARDRRTAAARGDAGRRFGSEVRISHAACKPGPPARGKGALGAKTCHAFEPRQRERIRTALLGKVEIRDHDDELVCERVF